MDDRRLNIELSAIRRLLGVQICILAEIANKLGAKGCQQYIDAGEIIMGTAQNDIRNLSKPPVDSDPNATASTSVS